MIEYPLFVIKTWAGTNSAPLILILLIRLIDLLMSFYVFVGLWCYLHLRSDKCVKFTGVCRIGV